MAPHLPDVLSMLFMKALNHDPDTRFQTGEEFAAALRTASQQARGSESEPPATATTATDSESADTAEMNVPDEA